MAKSPKEPGQTSGIPILFVVATPIGNLSDLTDRARETLAEAGVAAAEDTRRTLGLLSHLGIKKRLISYREENRERAAREIIACLMRGDSVALVTDAGTPGLSDPGHYLVAEALAAGFRVVPIPGPSALAAALSVSGLPAERFVFEGFLPAKPGPRRKRLSELAAVGHPLVVYESPNRLMGTLSDLREVLGDRRVVVGREISKLHEEFLRGTVSEVLEALAGREVVGEVTLVVEGGEPSRLPPDLGEAVVEMRRAGLSAGQTASILAKLTGADRREIYRLASGQTPPPLPHPPPRGGRDHK